MAKAARNVRSNEGGLNKQSYLLAVICLLIGVAVGYFLRGSGLSETAATSSPQQSVAPGVGLNVGQTDLSAAVLKQQVEPLLTFLKSNPNDVSTLTKLGNVYYDGHDYKNAIEYYQKALNIRPEDADVRTDMGTCFWYLGNADKALAEFEKSLKYNPTHAGTLFNMGIVKSQGKNDPRGAIAAWQKLLMTNPMYPQRAKVEELIAQAQQQAGGIPGKK